MSTDGPSLCSSLSSSLLDRFGPSRARLADLELRSAEGVTILGIEREDGTYIGAPSGDHRIHSGDRVVAYGQAERLKELADRGEDDEAAHEAAKRDHDRLLDRERELDPKRSLSAIRE